MIVMAVFRVIASVLGSVLDTLPSAASLGIPDVSSYVTAIGDSRVWQWFGWANHFIPLDLALLLFGARLVIWALLYGAQFVIWCLTKVHILGGAS